MPGGADSGLLDIFFVRELDDRMDKKDHPPLGQKVRDEAKGHRLALSRPIDGPSQGLANAKRQPDLQRFRPSHGGQTSGARPPRT
jgi:hypothetical protein